MASQVERVLGVVDMCNSVFDSMVQDKSPEQDTPVQEQFFPQTDLEPEMGAAAAAVCDTSPPPLHQTPPILAESAQLSTPDIAQLCAMLAGINAKMDGNAQQMENKMEGLNKEMNGMNNKMEANTNGIKEELKEEMKKMRGEMQQIGQVVQ